MKYTLVELIEIITKLIGDLEIDLIHLKLTSYRGSTLNRLKMRPPCYIRLRFVV
jgi:hypothetical protein